MANGKTKEGADRWPRMMLLKEAADYCGVCPQKFKILCPVKPVAMDVAFSKSTMLRYDRAKLDAWLDSLSAGAAPQTEEVDWIALGRQAGVC